MSHPSPFWSRRWFQAIALAGVTWLAVLAVFGRWRWADWSAPHWFEGDPIEVYARVQIAAEQPWHALTSFAHPARLGAPFGADWSGYTVPDRLVFVLTGALAHAVGLVAAVQLVSAAGFVLNAVSFFLCARWLGRRWEWAAAFALGFAFCNYNLRWGITLSLAQTFTLPPLVLLCAHAGGHARSARQRRWIALALLLGAWLGLGNPYLAFFSGVVAGGALLLALARRAPAHRLLPLAGFLGALGALFLAANLGYALAHWRGPDSGALARDLSDFTRYALRPLEWFVPPADHRIGGMAELGRAYLASRHGDGEFFYNYLGLAGALGLAWLLIASARRLPRAPLRQAAGLGLLWIVVFGMAGGLNAWLGRAGLDVFRASTRIGVFAALWVAFFLTGRLHRASVSWPRSLSVVLAAGLAAFLVWEQTPALADRAAPEGNLQRAHAYRALTQALEHTLPAGAAVFQLPAVPFPEAGRTGAMTDYEHFQPFLASRTLRFSYGNLRTSPAHRWERHVAALPPEAMIAALEQAGFSALWIDRRGFADGGAALIAQARNLPRAEITTATDLPIAIFRLSPADPPRRPDLDDPRLHEPWDPAVTTADARWLALRGWYGVERAPARTWRWAAREAELGLWHEGAAQKVRLTFGAGGRTHTRLRLRFHGAEIWSTDLQDGAARPHSLVVELQPGLNTFTWQLTGRTFRPGPGDPRDLGFMIENPALSAP